MKLLSRLSLSRTSFLHQLVLTFAVGILALAIASSFVISSLSSRSVADKLIESGRSITETFAKQSVLALLYRSEDNAIEHVNATLNFPDIEGVAIYDEQLNPLLEMGSSARPSREQEPWPGELRIAGESDQAWYYVSPVYTGQGEETEDPFTISTVKPELIGYVRVAMGKATLKKLEGDILHVNLVTSLILAGLLLLVMLSVARRMTLPIKNLAEIMSRAEKGEKNLRANVEGPKDIKEMESAFNTMMQVLDTREEQLKLARDAALESARMKGEFAASVSHELRTPLNGVIGMLELLKDLELSPKQLEYVNVARQSGDILLDLIGDILDFSKLDSGFIEQSHEDFYVRDLLESVVGVLSSQTRDKNLDVGYVLDESLPQSLRGDVPHIRQLLINLGGNAVKFTESGEVVIEVDLVEEQSEGYLIQFRVRDTGIGIEEDARERIFEPFSQADSSTTRRFGGTGLGLTICKQLVELMGGELRVDSEPGLGSTFWFEIALKAAEGAVDIREEIMGDAAEGLRVLIVDDSVSNSTNLEQSLRKWGAYSRCANNAREALDLLRQAAANGRPFDVAIVDEIMPEMNGPDLIREISDDTSIPAAKIIMMMTRRVMGQHEAHMAGIASSLMKPVRQSELYDCIADILHPDVSGLAGVSEPQADYLPDDKAIHARILVVEDNRTNQQVATGMLERIQCEYEVASSGKEALVALQGNSFDLILMDCNMPEMDGYEATTKIRQLEKGDQHIPIVAMTANVQEGDANRCLTAGMDDYLPKPITLKPLKKMLECWLPHRQAERRVMPHTGDSVDKENAAESLSEHIDREAFSELRDSVGGALEGMIQVFREDTPVYINDMSQALAEGNAKLFADKAHSIKGSSLNLGATRLADICRQCEEHGRNNALALARNMMDALKKESEAVMRTLGQQVIPPEYHRKLQPDKRVAGRILIVDDDRGIILALRNVLETDGYFVEEVLNGRMALEYCSQSMPDLVLMDAVMPEMDGFTACKEIRDLPGGSHIPILVITALDDDHSIEATFTAGATDYIPKPVHFAVLRQRISRLLTASRAEKHIHQLAFNDSLTGLPNRALFMNRLGELLVKASDKAQKVAILFLDLDRFKLVNDTLGHDVGDLLLKAVAERILGCVRDTDMVARLGGDEFTLILDEVTTRGVVATIAEKICAALNEPFTFIGQEMYVSTSIGISIYPEDGRDISSLMKHADTAMFKAKEFGGQFQFYEPGMEAAVIEQVGLENDLRRALMRNELDVHYQPKCELESGNIVGMEALVRWDHPQRGPISPAEFIPLAEQTGLIQDVGLWVLITSCVQLQSWISEGYSPLCVSVNLSGRQLEYDISTQVAEVLEKTGLHPGFLELEITESSIMKNPEEVIDVLNRLQEMGVDLAIDDFGTGYSSLNYLKRFPINTLKIDRSFVRDIVTDPDDMALISGIIALAKSLRLKVVAEGVETDEQQSFLKVQECDMMQGYLLSKPLPAAEFEEQILRSIKRGDLTAVNSNVSLFPGNSRPN